MTRAASHWASWGSRAEPSTHPRLHKELGGSLGELSEPLINNPALINKQQDKKTHQLSQEEVRANPNMHDVSLSVTIKRMFSWRNLGRPIPVTPAMFVK